MLNFSHTDLTDLTDFRLLRSFSIETKWEYPLLATKKIREICEIRVRLKYLRNYDT